MMGDEGRVPTSPIKPRLRPSGAVVFQRGGGDAAGGGRRVDWKPPFPRSRPGPGRSRVPSPIAGPTETRRGRLVKTPPAGALGSLAEREGPGGPGRGEKGEIRETSLSGKTRQTGFGQGGRSRQGGAGSGPRERGGELGRGCSASAARD